MQLWNPSQPQRPLAFSLADPTAKGPESDHAISINPCLHLIVSLHLRPASRDVMLSMVGSNVISYRHITFF